MSVVALWCLFGGDVSFAFASGAPVEPVSAGRFLRWHSDPVKSFQGIVTDVVKCHNISIWEVKASNLSHFVKLQRISQFSFLPVANLFLCEQCRRVCERTSMPSPIRWVSQ